MKTWWVFKSLGMDFLFAKTKKLNIVNKIGV